MHRLSESVHCDSSPENNKIITLIRQKIYPLHYDHSSPFRLPRITLNQKQLGTSKRKYVQVEISEEQKSNVAKTEVEEQLRYLNKLKEKASSMHREPLSPRREPVTTHLACIKDSFALKKFNQLMSSHSKKWLKTETTCNESFFYKDIKDSPSFMQRMKCAIDDKKRTYIKKIKKEELIPHQQDRSNYSIQYLVDRLDHCKGQKYAHLQPFTQLSPNRLPQYIDMIRNDRTVTKSKKEIQIANVPLHRKDSNYRINNNKKATILVQQGQQQNEISAKMRMKSNHKRMIQLSK